MAFTQAELEAATRKGKQATLDLFQREYNSGFARSLPASMVVDANGKVQHKPDTWLEKYGWTLPLIIEAAAPIAGAAAGGSGPAIMTGPTVAQEAAGAAGAAGMGFSWGDAIKYGTELFGGLWGSHEQSKAANKSADQMAEATKYAADQSLEANREATAYAQGQSTLDRATAEANRRGNYDQWLAHDQRVGSLGQLAGLPARVSPAYVPLPNGAGGGSGAPSGPAPNVDASKGDLAGQISAYFKSRGVSDQETPYWVSKWAEFGAKDPAYFNQRLAAADIFGGGASAPAAAPRATAPVAAQAPRTLLDYAQLPMNPALTGQVFLPPSLRA